MRIIMLALSLFLFSCESGLRHDLGVNFEIEHVRGQNDAMALFEEMVEEEYGLELEHTWRDVSVWWVDDSCDGRDDYGIQYDGECRGGLSWGDGHLYVALSNMGLNRICTSSLIHEYAHWLSGELWGHPSFDSWGCDWKERHPGEYWDLVLEAEDIACERGL